MDESFRDLEQHSVVPLAATCLKPRENKSICKQGLRMLKSNETAILMILDNLQTKLQVLGLTVVS